MMYVNTNQYEFSHGHRPRGRGYWAFFVGHPNKGLLYWSEGEMLYSAAATDAKRFAKQNGYYEVTVAP